MSATNVRILRMSAAASRKSVKRLCAYAGPVGFLVSEVVLGVAQDEIEADVPGGGLKVLASAAL